MDVSSQGVYKLIGLQIMAQFKNYYNLFVNFLLKQESKAIINHLNMISYMNAFYPKSGVVVITGFSV